MNIISKLLTAVRGSARELGEAVVDSQSLRIFEQEIHDSKENLTRAKQGLTEIVAKKMAVDRKLNELHGQISEHEGFAIQALAQKDEALALQVAEKIAKLEVERQNHQQDRDAYQQNITLLKNQVQEAEKIIAEHERELALVKTRESVQQATRSVTQSINHNDTAIGSARESLERIKQKQQADQDRLEAGVNLRKEMADDALDQKLKAAGIKQEAHSAQAVLARLRQSQS